MVSIERQLAGDLFSSAAAVSTGLSETLSDELRFQLSTATRRLRALQLDDAETTILKAFILFLTGVYMYTAHSTNKYTHPFNGTFSGTTRA